MQVLTKTLIYDNKGKYKKLFLQGRRERSLLAISVSPSFQLPKNTMTFYQPQIYSSPLEQAIDRDPLKVMPETPLTEVLKLMDRVQSTCNLPDRESRSTAEGRREIPLWEQRRGSCVLVLENPDIPRGKKQSPKSSLAGIFTDRDIVELIVNGKIDSQNNTAKYW